VSCRRRRRRRRRRRIISQAAAAAARFASTALRPRQPTAHRVRADPRIYLLPPAATPRHLHTFELPDYKNGRFVAGRSLVPGQGTIPALAMLALLFAWFRGSGSDASDSDDDDDELDRGRRR